MPLSFPGIPHLPKVADGGKTIGQRTSDAAGAAVKDGVSNAVGSAVNATVAKVIAPVGVAVMGGMMIILGVAMLISTSKTGRSVGAAVISKVP